jgi:hypothetical protein
VHGPEKWEPVFRRGHAQNEKVHGPETWEPVFRTGHAQSEKAQPQQPNGLDTATVQQAVQRYTGALARARSVAAAARAERDKRIAARQARNRAESDIRALALLVRAMRDRKAIADGEPSRKPQRNAAGDVRPAASAGLSVTAVRRASPASGGGKKAIAG